MTSSPTSSPSGPTTQLARYIMVGGFLGAGKTTTVARLAQHFHDQGLRVGLITNDQGSGLVDTTTLKAKGFPVEEITGGCFCCRFNSLTDAAARLSAKERPDVFIAEPVGSCTDLVATVTYPLRRIYGDRFLVAPLSVLMDPIRALRLFGLEAGSKFSAKVSYIYRKQLEEADILVINKSDLLNSTQLAALKARLESEFPGKLLHIISARSAEGLLPWFQLLTRGEQVTKPVIGIDYDEYAEGEALLGWMNATLRIHSESTFDANAFLKQFASQLQSTLAGQSVEIAHMKMTIEPTEGLGDLAVLNLVRSDSVGELGIEAGEEMTEAELTLNLRAEAEPEVLKAALDLALGFSESFQSGMTTSIHQLESFRPGRPTPTHRES